MNNIAKVFSYSKGVESKRKELIELGEQLKKEFIGIDVVINNIIKLMEPWRIMPDAQNRPIIINLWGMTGTGKTSLVRRISEILKAPLIQIDLGEYSDSKNFSLDFYDKYSDLADKESIILLDEIQNCRTLDYAMNDIERPAIRGLWSLLSDGKIIPDKRISKEYYQEDINDCINIYKNNKGVVPGKSRDSHKEDVVILDQEGKQKIFDQLAKQFGKDKAKYDEVIAKAVEAEEAAEEEVPWKVSDWTISGILRLSGNNIKYDKYEIQEMLEKDFISTANMLLEKLDKLDIQPQLNYKNSIIFIAGNLDELYTMSRNANPDITPDTLHELSKKITVPDVKNVLLRKFKPEQVARFCNNHLIYHAFNEENFRDIIRLDLKRIKNNILDKYDINLIFDNSVENLIYSEGVFPTQGARPVLSTISTLIESSLPSCLKEIITQYEDNKLEAPINIKMKLDGGNSNAIFVMVDENDRELNKEKIFLSIDILRKPIYDEEHVIVAVHEAGHTICQIVELGELPIKICAFSPNSNSDGYMEKKMSDFFTKETMLSLTTISLGGFAAERIIFGENKTTTGSSCDIAKATENAVDSIQFYGFGELPIKIQRKSSPDSHGVEYNDNTDSNISDLIKTCLGNAEKIVNDNKGLLLDISCELLNNPFLLSNDIDNILKRNNFELIKNNNLIDKFEEELKDSEIDWKPKY